MQKRRSRNYESLYGNQKRLLPKLSAHTEQYSYDLLTKTLHWLFAIAIIYNTLSGYSLMWIQSHAVHDFISTFNVSLATLLCILFPIRVIWMHFRKELPAVEGTSKEQHAIAKFARSLLYMVITVVLISGYLMIPDGYSFFWLFDITTPFTEGDATHYFFVIHRISCALLAGLVLLHVAAVVQHYVMHHVNIVRRML